MPDLYGEIMASADSSGLFEGGYAVDNGGGVKAVRRIGKPFLYSACTFLIVCVSVVAIVLPLIKEKRKFRTSCFKSDRAVRRRLLRRGCAVVRKTSFRRCKDF